MSMSEPRWRLSGQWRFWLLNYGERTVVYVADYMSMFFATVVGGGTGSPKVTERFQVSLNGFADVLLRPSRVWPVVMQPGRSGT